MDRFRIAVIDDEPIVGREVKRGLSKEPYEIETFLDGESALQRLEQVDFDLVLCDLRLPGMSGLDVLKAVRKRYPWTRSFSSPLTARWIRPSKPFGPGRFTM